MGSMYIGCELSQERLWWPGCHSTEKVLSWWATSLIVALSSLGRLRFFSEDRINDNHMIETLRIDKTGKGTDNMSPPSSFDLLMTDNYW